MVKSKWCRSTKAVRSPDYAYIFDVAGLLQSWYVLEMLLDDGLVRREVFIEE